jgi:hypothetical protein
MTPEQKQRLRFASLCATPISATVPPEAAKRWARSRSDVLKALKGRNLEAGLKGCVFIEACREMDRYITRVKATGSAA